MAKYPHDSIVPDNENELDKKGQVVQMFNSIAFRYDYLNQFLSGGIDKRWRTKAIMELKDAKPQLILDVATGTGDVAILTYQLIKPKKIVGIDLAGNMLDIGHQKIERLGLQKNIELLRGDAETINCASGTFDAVTAAFGVRNFENLEAGLSEMLRVLAPGGKAVILEFSKPNQIFFRMLYYVYMNVLVPLFGKLISKNRNAYKYLNNSVKNFPQREDFIRIMQKTGFKKTYFKTLSLGICCIYCGSRSY